MIKFIFILIINDGLKIISNDDDNLGYSVSDAGDINGDNIDDIIAHLRTHTEVSDPRPDLQKELPREPV